MNWCLSISIVGAFSLLVLLDIERHKRKCLETVVAKLRNHEKLNEQEVELYVMAKRFDWQGNELPT